MFKFNWDFGEIQKKLPFCYSKHRHWNNYTSLLCAQFDAKKYYCNKKESISCKQLAETFIKMYDEIKHKYDSGNCDIILPFKFCACIPILFQSCLCYRILYLISDINIKKLFYRIYLSDYELITKTNPYNKLLYNNEKIESVCGNHSVQLYTRTITNEIFKLCVKFINDKLDIETTDSFVLNIKDNTPTKVYWIEHYNNPEYVYKVDSIYYKKFDYLNDQKIKPKLDSELNLETNKQTNVQNKEYSFFGMFNKQTKINLPNNLSESNNLSKSNNSSNIPKVDSNLAKSSSINSSNIIVPFENKINKDIASRMRSRIEQIEFTEMTHEYVEKIKNGEFGCLYFLKNEHIKVKNGVFNWIDQNNIMFENYTYYTKFLTNIHEDLVLQNDTQSIKTHHLYILQEYLYSGNSNIINVMDKLCLNYNK